MSEMKNPVAVIFEVGTDICKWSGKKAEGARMTIENSPVQNMFLSWTSMKKMLAFSTPSVATSSEAGGGKK